jgi:hypothetical protein
MTFKEWADQYSDMSPYGQLVTHEAWQTATHEERDRIVWLIKQATRELGNCDRLIEAIYADTTHGH